MCMLLTQHEWTPGPKISADFRLHTHTLHLRWNFPPGHTLHLCLHLPDHFSHFPARNTSKCRAKISSRFYRNRLPLPPHEGSLSNIRKSRKRGRTLLHIVNWLLQLMINTSALSKHGSCMLAIDIFFRDLPNESC